jgi:hypothetical protein
MGKRSRGEDKWNEHFIITKGLFYLMDSLWSEHENESLIRTAASAFRNPIIFDNKVSGAYYKLPYKCGVDVLGKTVDDHLIGISNTVLYIYKKKLYERWVTSNDFKMTLKSLQILLTIPQKLNTSKDFKSWQFNLNTVDNCIYWNNKLKKNGINYLTSEDGSNISVDEIWNDWYNTNKDIIT